jgi:hypothetical protein
MGMPISWKPHPILAEILSGGVKNFFPLTLFIRGRDRVERGVQSAISLNDPTWTTLFSTLLTARVASAALKPFSDPSGVRLSQIWHHYSWNRILSLATKEGILFSSFAINAYLNREAGLQKEHQREFLYSASFLGGVVASIFSHTAEEVSRRCLQARQIEISRIFKATPLTKAAGMGLVSVIYTWCYTNKIIS